MLKDLLSGGPLIRILIEHLLNKVECIEAYELELLLHLRQVACGDLMHEHRNALAIEWLLARKHHVEHSTSGPNVNLLIVFLLHENFRRGECHRACLRHHFLDLAAIFALGKRDIEVHYKKFIIFGYQQVLRFNVTMHNFL